MSPGAPPYLPQSNDLLAGSPCPSKAPPVTGGWWLATKYPHRQECSPSREPTQVPHLVTLHPGWASRVLGGCGSGLGSPLWLDAGIPWPGGWPCQPPVPDLSLPPPEADLWHLAPEPVHKVTGPSHPTPGVLCYPLSGFSTMTSFLSASFFCGLSRTILTLALLATGGRLHTSCPAGLAPWAGPSNGSKGLSLTCGPTNAFEFTFSVRVQRLGLFKLWALGQLQTSRLVTMQILPGEAPWAVRWALDWALDSPACWLLP